MAVKKCTKRVFLWVRPHVFVGFSVSAYLPHVNSIFENEMQVFKNDSQVESFLS